MKCFKLISKIYISLLIFQISVLISMDCISQGNYKLPVITPKSPDAASLGNYTESPVSFYNGVPQIDIPLYSISYKGINVPIGISYNASGIKIEEIPSSIGSGWSLNAGGSISRIVRGIPDELTNGFISGQKNVTKIYLEQFSTQAIRKQLIDDILHGVKDAEPDIFILSLPGFSCKFFFDEDAVIHTIPKSKVKITPGPVGGLGYRSWVVVTPDGVKYELGSNDGSELGGGIEKTRTLSSCSDIFEESYSNWYINRILPLVGEPVVFSYDSYTINNVNTTFQRRFNKIGATNAPGSNGGNCIGDFIHCTSTTTIFSNKIKSITFNNGIVTFQPGSVRQDLVGDKSIDQIIVSNNNGTTIKKYIFYQSYRSTSPYIESSLGKRLFLDSLRVFDAQICNDLGCVENPQLYVFGYNPEPLPPRNSFSQDYWGYYNGKFNGEFLVPKMIITSYVNPNSPQLMSLEGADRLPDEYYTKAGVLEKITYPTGGSLDFSYELNDVQDGVPYFKTQAASYFYSYPTPPVGDDMAGIFTVATCNDKPKIVHVISTGVSTPDPATAENKQQWRIYKWNASNNDFTDIVASFGSLTEPNTSEKDIYLYAGNYRVQMYRPNSSALNYPATVSIVWRNDIDCFKRPAGGLRVKETKFKDGVHSESILSTQYEYTMFGDISKSSGGVANFPEYHFVDNEDVATIVTVIVDNQSTENQTFIDHCVFFRRNSISNQPLSSTGMGSVGYQNITVYKRNGVEQLGKSELTFISPRTIPDGLNADFPFAPSNSLEWQRGGMIKMVEYRSRSLNQFEEVQRVENTYIPIEIEDVRGFKTGVDDYKLAFTFGSIQDVSIPKEQFFYTGTGFNYIGYSKTRVVDQKVATRVQEVENTTVINPYNYEPAYSSTYDSKGDLLTTYTKYTSDYNTSTTSDNWANSLKTLKDKNVLVLPVETYVTRKDASNNEWVISGRLVKYTGFGLPDSVFELSISQPLLRSSFAEASIIPGGFFQHDVKYRLVEVFCYDNFGNTIEQYKDKDFHTKFIYDYNQEFPIAECINCNDIVAYTSFETDKVGNWEIVSANRTGSGITGSSSYSMTEGLISKSGLVVSNKYVVSYWSSNGALTVSGTQGNVIQGKTISINGTIWTYYEHFVSGVSIITLSGSGKIDELRLYPAKGMMTTYTYFPLMGLQSKCDINNVASYFVYDEFGRLKMIRDFEGNTLKTFEYKFQESQY